MNRRGCIKFPLLEMAIYFNKRVCHVSLLFVVSWQVVTKMLCFFVSSLRKNVEENFLQCSLS